MENSTFGQGHGSVPHHLEFPCRVTWACLRWRFSSLCWRGLGLGGRGAEGGAVPVGDIAPRPSVKSSNPGLAKSTAGADDELLGMTQCLPII